MDNIGKRFLKLSDDKFEIVDMAEYFGQDDEKEKEKLINKILIENSSSDDTVDSIDELEEELDAYADDSFDDYADEFEDDVEDDSESL